MAYMLEQDLIIAVSPWSGYVTRLHNTKLKIHYKVNNLIFIPWIVDMGKILVRLDMFYI